MYKYNITCDLGYGKVIVPAWGDNIEKAKKWLRKNFFVQKIFKVKRKKE